MFLSSWFNIFEDDGSSGVRTKTEVVTGDNGAPAGKDIGYLMSKVVTNDNKLRIVVKT